MTGSAGKRWQPRGRGRSAASAPGLAGVRPRPAGAPPERPREFGPSTGDDVEDLLEIGRAVLDRAEALADARHFDECVLACDAILQLLAARIPGPPARLAPLRAEVLTCKGRALDGAGHQEDSLACLERARELLDGRQDAGSAAAAAARARAMSLLGVTLIHLGRGCEAVDPCRGAVSVLRPWVGRSGIGELAAELARALTRLGQVQLLRSQVHDALKSLDEAIPIYDRLMFESGRDELRSELDEALACRMEAMERVG